MSDESPPAVSPVKLVAGRSFEPPAVNSPSLPRASPKQRLSRERSLSGAKLSVAFGDRHDISDEMINSFISDVESNPKTVLAINAVCRGGIDDVVINRRRSVKDEIHAFSHPIEKEGKPVTNQKSSGRCWLFAALNTFRIPFIKTHNLDKFEFSQSYMLFWDKLEKSNYFLNNIIETRHLPIDHRVVMWLLSSSELVSDGGQWDMFVNLVEKYGVVPKSVYPETYHSGSTRRMNWLLRAKLRDYASLLRKAHQGGEKEATLHSMKNVYLEEVFRLLCVFLGVPPKTFNWTYMDKDNVYHEHCGLSPTSFFTKLVRFPLEDMVCLINAPTADKPLGELYTVKYLGNMVGGHPVRYINVSIEDLKQMAASQIMERKEPVWFGCDVGKYHAKELGVLDTEMFNYQLVFDFKVHMDKATRLDYGESQMTHAMVLTAVHYDEAADRPTRWRVENSWGDDKGRGKKGYWLMTDKWFDEYTYEVVVHKDVVPKEIMEILKRDPVVLQPWDPMGSLAC